MGKRTSIGKARRQTAGGRAAIPIEKLLAEARRKLMETGTRNRLIHTPRGTKRPRTITITGNAADQVFANLVRESDAAAGSRGRGNRGQMRIGGPGIAASGHPSD